MKKFLVLVLALVILGSVALADGSVHECDLCGRRHAGTLCPEACQNDCSLEEVHYWYNCPDLIIAACWHCHDDSGNHYANVCPDGEVFWNDLKGCFRSIEHAGEAGTRLPRYCSNCGYYGYHNTSECVNDYNSTNPETTKKPNEDSCSTHYFDIEYQEVVYQENMTGKYCQVTEYCNHLVCDSCGYEDEETDENRVAHEIKNGRCCICGYTRNGWEANISEETREESVTSDCQHKYTTEFYVGVAWYEDGGNVCLRNINFEVVCDRCGEVLDEDVEVDKKEHFMIDGVCKNCNHTED